MDESKIDVAVAYSTAGYETFPVHSADQGQCTCGKQECKNAGKHPRNC